MLQPEQVTIQRRPASVLKEYEINCAEALNPLKCRYLISIPTFGRGFKLAFSKFAGHKPLYFQKRIIPYSCDNRENASA